MFISLIATPRFSINLTAFECVRVVVPKPGIVIPIMPLRSSFRRSKVLTAISRANVESKPPDIPTVSVLHPIASRRFAKAAT